MPLEEIKKIITTPECLASIATLIFLIRQKTAGAIENQQPKSKGTITPEYLRLRRILGTFTPLHREEQGCVDAFLGGKHDFTAEQVTILHRSLEFRERKMRQLGGQKELRETGDIF